MSDMAKKVFKWLIVIGVPAVIILSMTLIFFKRMRPSNGYLLCIVLVIGGILAYILLDDSLLTSTTKATEYDAGQKFQWKIDFEMINRSFITVYVWSNTKAPILNQFRNGKKYIFHQNGQVIIVPIKQVLSQRIGVMERH